MPAGRPTRLRLVGPGVLRLDGIFRVQDALAHVACQRTIATVAVTAIATGCAHRKIFQHAQKQRDDNNQAPQQVDQEQRAPCRMQPAWPQLPSAPSGAPNKATTDNPSSRLGITIFSLACSCTGAPCAALAARAARAARAAGWSTRRFTRGSRLRRPPLVPPPRPPALRPLRPFRTLRSLRTLRTRDPRLSPRLACLTRATATLAVSWRRIGGDDDGGSQRRAPRRGNLSTASRSQAHGAPSDESSVVVGPEARRSMRRVVAQSLAAAACGSSRSPEGRYFFPRHATPRARARVWASGFFTGAPDCRPMRKRARRGEASVHAARVSVRARAGDERHE